MTLRQQQAAPGRHSALLNTNCWSARIDPKRTFWSLMGILFDQIVSFVLLKWDYFPIFPKMCKMIYIYGRCCGNQSVRPHTTPLLLVPPGLGPLSDIQQASQSHHPSTINQSLSSIWLWWPIRASLWLGIRVGSIRRSESTDVPSPFQEFDCLISQLKDSGKLHSFWKTML